VLDARLAAGVASPAAAESAAMAAAALVTLRRVDRPAVA
jgi:hypothetical protein